MLTDRRVAWAPSGAGKAVSAVIEVLALLDLGRRPVLKNKKEDTRNPKPMSVGP